MDPPPAKRLKTEVSPWVVVSSQLATETTCSYCSFNNFLQLKYPRYSEKQFWQALDDVSPKRALNANRKEQAREGIRGTGLDVTLLLAKQKEVAWVNPVLLKHIPTFQKDGILKIGGPFGHDMAIRDGWVIDSITRPGTKSGTRINRWRGNLADLGYGKDFFIYKITEVSLKEKNMDKPKEEHVFIEID
jgi:hypothetical protein